MIRQCDLDQVFEKSLVTYIQVGGDGFEPNIWSNLY